MGIKSEMSRPLKKWPTKINKFGSLKMITKVEAEFWAWMGTVERHPADFRSEFELWAQGCPEYLLRAICDVRGIGK